MASGGSWSMSSLGYFDEYLDSVASSGGSRSIHRSFDELLDSACGSMSVLVSSDEAFEFECGLCNKDGKYREAKTFCPECKSYMCDSCKDAHSRFPALQNHRTVSIDEMKNICVICNAGGKKKEARCFCKNCDAWICDDCKQLHESYPELQKHILVSGKDIVCCDSTSPWNISGQSSQLSTKSSDQDLFSNSGSKPKQRSIGGNKIPTQPSQAAVASSSLTKTPNDDLNVHQSYTNVLHFKTIEKITRIDVRVSDDSNCFITGCCFMPGGELVLCDYNNRKIKLLDHSLSAIDSLDLPEQPRDVVCVDSSNVIVTDQKQLQFIQVLPSLKKSCSIDVGKECYGVALADCKIFVSYYRIRDKPSEIRVYDLEGRVPEKILGISPDGSNMFHCPMFVAVSRSGDKIFVSDYFTHRVSCLTSDGKMVYQYKDDELRRPCGLYVDDNDNVIICGYSSDTVRIITSAGMKHKTLALSSEDGLSGPWCVSYRPSDGTLVVGCKSRDHLLVYKML